MTNQNEDRGFYIDEDKLDYSEIEAEVEQFLDECIECKREVSPGEIIDRRDLPTKDHNHWKVGEYLRQNYEVIDSGKAKVAIDRIETA